MKSTWLFFAALLFATSFKCEKDDKKTYRFLGNKYNRPEIAQLEDPKYASVILSALDQLDKEKETSDNLKNHKTDKYDFQPIYQPNLEPSLPYKDTPDDDDAYNSMIEYYNKNYGLKNNTEHHSAVKEMLKKLLYGVPVFFGYYRVFSYLNEICLTGATCSNVTITTSVTSTKLKSTRLTETAVLTSMKTKTATSSISETSTKVSTTVRITTLPATTTTYRTNTKTAKSTITTTTTTHTKKTFTFKFTESTTTVGYTTITRYSITRTFFGKMEVLFDYPDDEEFIEISPTAGGEITATYSWSKFSAFMSSFDATTDAEDEEEWSSQETSISDQDFSQRTLFSPLEGSKSSDVEASSISYGDY